MKQVARNLTDVRDGFLLNNRYLIIDRAANTLAVCSITTIVKQPESENSVFFAPYAMIPLDDLNECRSLPVFLKRAAHRAIVNTGQIRKRRPPN
jgi:hypothetical protein